MSSRGNTLSTGTALAVLGVFAVLLVIVAFFGYCALVGMTHVLGVSIAGALGIYVAVLIVESCLIALMKAAAR